jgi:hypothetical protein
VAGSVGRVASSSIERPVIEPLQSKVPAAPSVDDATLLNRHLSQIKVSDKQVVVFYHLDLQQTTREGIDESKVPLGLSYRGR